MELNKLLQELKERFWRNNTFFKSAHACEESVLQTIKAFFIKKNLIIVSKAEYDALVDFRDKQILRDLSEPVKFY